MFGQWGEQSSHRPCGGTALTMTLLEPSGLIPNKIGQLSVVLLVYWHCLPRLLSSGMVPTHWLGQAFR
jgi:hypothetical protein